MNVIEEKVPELIKLLENKARRRSAIRYSAIFDFFDPDTHRNDVWETFEEACRKIAPSEVAIYGALLAKKIPIYLLLDSTIFSKISGMRNI